MATPGHSNSSGEKKNIASVHKYFKKEKEELALAVRNKILDKNIPIDYVNARKRTADALSVSLRNVDRVCAEMKSGQVNLPNHQKKGRTKIEFDSFTLDFIHKTLQEDPNFPRMGKTTLWRRLRQQLKFKFCKFHNKPVAMESDEIVVQRHNYLRSVRKYRAEGYKIYWTDETWANANQSPSSGWHMPERQVLGMGNGSSHIDIWLKGVGKRFVDGVIGAISSRPSGAGRRVIMIHIGSEDGFLQGAGKVFKREKNTNDYHNEMNHQHFEEWFSKVIELIPEKSVIVIDQASHHKSVCNVI